MRNKHKKIFDLSLCLKKKRTIIGGIIGFYVGPSGFSKYSQIRFNPISAHYIIY